MFDPGEPKWGNNETSRVDFIRLIGGVCAEVALTDECISFAFENGNSLKIDLSPDDYEVAEVIDMSGKLNDQTFFVV